MAVNQGARASVTFFEGAPDKDELRRAAPLGAVAAALGVRLDSQGRGLCPFHEDTRPSFSLWVDPAGVQRWGCFPCGLSGDCFDLVQRLEVTSFGAAVRRVAEIARDAPPWEAPPARVELDREGLEAYVREAQDNAIQPWNKGLLCVAASLADEAAPITTRVRFDRVLRELGWGVDDRACVVIPHRSPGGELTGAKVRAPDGQKWAYPGSEFKHLYGCWLSSGRASKLLLAEGETDFAHARLRGCDELGVHALSVPSGAKGPRPDWVDAVVGAFDDVYLGLDGDDSGRRAATEWTRALTWRRAETRVWDLHLPDGLDLRSCGRSFETLVGDAVRRRL